MKPPRKPNHAGFIDWTPPIVELLTAGWLDGKSARVIAVEIKTAFPETKCNNNMVIGKVKRLNLPGRKSPIIRQYAVPNRREMILKLLEQGRNFGYVMKETGASEKAVRLVKQSLIKKALIQKETDDALMALRQPPPPYVPPPKIEPEVVAVIQPVLVFRQSPGRRKCEWLSGERRAYIRCDAPSAYHTSWCNEHGKLCFTVWPPRAMAA